MLNIGNSTRFRLGDKVTVIVDDSCGYAKGHRGAITELHEHEAGFIVYEIDDSGYEYSEEELELTNVPLHSTMKFKVGDDVTVIVGEYTGINGKIRTVDDNDTELPYCIQGDLWFTESELTLKYKIDSVISALSDTPKLNPESKVEINDDDEISKVSQCIIRNQREFIDSLKSELLSLYRELHRINKDSQN